MNFLKQTITLTALLTLYASISYATCRYTIQPNDTLGKIATQHNTAIDTLLESNPQITHPDKIKYGRKINVPCSKNTTEKIAQEYNFNQFDLTEYQALIKQAIEESQRTRKPVILIDKADYELRIYQFGRIVKTFPIELGKNPYDNKQMQGDNTTPEGRYTITKLKEGGETRFYKAAEIDYPSQTDSIRFTKLKRAQKIPTDATIGSDINIHGHGHGVRPQAGGRNWTQGCIALSDEQMDELFPHLNIGTSVYIIRYDSPNLKK